MDIKKIILGIAILLTFTSCADVDKEAFLTEIAYEDFETVDINDFYNINFGGSNPTPVIWNDRLFINSLNYVQEYNLEGEIVAYVDPKLGDSPRDLVLMGDSLFIAYYNVGIYEIDLNLNEVVYLYDTTNGLDNLSNLNLVVNGEELWVGTYEGVAKINTNSHQVSFYTEELNITGTHFGSDVYTGGGEVWVTVSANAESNGGATRYDAATDSWDAYGIEYFKTGESTRIDFGKFIVSDEGVFAVFYDDEPELLTLKKYNPDEKTWTTLYTDDRGDAFYVTIEQYLPAKETYMRGEYESESDNHVFSVYYEGQWVDFNIAPKEYLSLIRGDKSTYYLFSNQGLEIFRRGDDLPTFLAENLIDYLTPNYNLFITNDGRYLISLLVSVETYGGPKWNDFFVAAYDLETGELFTASLDLREMDVFQSSEEINDLEVADLNYTYNENILTIQFLDKGEFVFDILGEMLKFT